MDDADVVDQRRLALHRQIQENVKRFTRVMTWGMRFCMWNLGLMFLVMVTKKDPDLYTFVVYVGYAGWLYAVGLAGFAFWQYKRSLRGLYAADLADLKIPTEWK